jgi:hypothetical protein
MPLVALWKSAPDEIRGKSLQQLLAFAGKGQLLDGSETSLEFRDFLRHIPTELLGEYAQQCLSDSFLGSGLALQDLINQAGARLGFVVEEGRYRGNKNAVGFDGLWATENDWTILVEVKTSDTYNVNFDVIANYRKRLIDEQRLLDEKSSILYVVGKSDTGSLEAQVRGSRHAWNIRLISVEALFRLLSIKEELDEEDTLRRIRGILTPQEFTKVDGIIDLVFKTAKDITPDEIEAGDADPSVPRGQTGSDFRAECLERLQKLFVESLVRQTAVVYSTPSQDISVACMFSKNYGSAADASYWFGFHPSQQKRLEKARFAFVAFGCGSSENIFLMPLNQVVAWLPLMNVTDSNGRFYWHVVIYREREKYFLRSKQDLEDVDITMYLLPDAGTLDPSVLTRSATCP